MTDDWKPENLPILLMDRSLLTATRPKPYRIGTAKATLANDEAMLGFDNILGDKADEEVDDDASPSSQLQGRYQAGADWIEELTGMPYQVSYYFPSDVRNNRVGLGTYGSPNMTMKVLYQALCAKFNGGRPFIEDYFLSAFEDHMRDRYDQAVTDLKQRIADEAQKRRKAHRAYLSNYDTWASPMTKSVFNQLAKETKQDIVASLASGRIPLNKGSLSKSTMDTRERLGIDSTQVFYATGRLIRSIIVSVVLLDQSTADKEGVR